MDIHTRDIPAIIRKENDEFCVYRGHDAKWKSKRTHGTMKNWIENRIAVTFPLFWTPLPMNMYKDNSHILNNAIPELSDRLNDNYMLRTTGTEKSEFRILMHMADAVPEIMETEEKILFSKTGTLLDSQDNPILVNYQGNQYTVEIKGTDVPTPKKITGKLIVGELESRHVKTEADGLEKYAEEHELLYAAQGSKTGYIIRLNSLGNLRATYQESEGLELAMDKVDSNLLAQSLADKFFSSLDKGILIGSPHAENWLRYLNSGDEKLGYIDYEGVVNLKGTGPESSLSERLILAKSALVIFREFCQHSAYMEANIRNLDLLQNQMNDFIDKHSLTKPNFPFLDDNYISSVSYYLASMPEHGKL